MSYIDANIAGGLFNAEQRSEVIGAVMRMASSAAEGLHWVMRRSSNGLTLFFDGLDAWLSRARQRRQLAQLDGRALSDMGASRADMWQESSKLFFQK